MARTDACRCGHQRSRHYALGHPKGECAGSVNHPGCECKQFRKADDGAR